MQQEFIRFGTLSLDQGQGINPYIRHIRLCTITYSTVYSVYPPTLTSSWGYYIYILCVHISIQILHILYHI